MGGGKGKLEGKGQRTKKKYDTKFAPILSSSDWLSFETIVGSEYFAGFTFKTPDTDKKNSDLTFHKFPVYSAFNFIMGRMVISKTRWRC
jgi:hypothetical protein